MEKSRNRTISSVLILAALVGACLASPASALDKVTNMINEPLVGKLYHAYSPSVIADGEKLRMWLAGWMDKGVGGTDSLYYMQRADNKWSTPRAAFTKPGYELDEPSVIMHPSGKWYLMFYSMLMPPKPDKYTPRSERLAIGVAYGTPCAVSPDGSGICWKDYSGDKPYLGVGDGHGNAATSSPSAFFNGDELWLYYKRHGKKASFMRAKIEYATLKIEQQDAVTVQRFEPVSKKWVKEANSNQAAYSSASVARVGKNYVMVANAGFENGITRLDSPDGLQFHREPTDNNAAFIYYDNDHMLTPDIHAINDHSFRVYYGYAPKDSPCSQHFSRSGVQFYCSHSIQDVTVFTQPDR